jgi:hypothetical protein
MASFSYDVALEPTYIDFADIGSGYGILSVPIDGFLPEDSIGTVTLVIAPTSGTGDTISKAIDMVQRTDGYFEYVTQDAISAHFSLTPDDLETINAGTYGYSVSAIVTRNGVVRQREVQAGNIAARPTAVTPPLIVASIVITGGPLTGTTGDSSPLSAAAFDAYDNEIAGQLITWSSSNPLVAQVDQSGNVTFLLPGVATITASAQGVEDTTTATSQDPAFSAPLTNQVPVYNGSAWEPDFVTPEMLKPGTFGDNVAHDPYVFPHGVEAASLAGDGAAITGLDMAHAAAGTLSVARGGTGLGTMGSIGAILYATAALSLAALAGNTSATKKFLSQTGDGSASAAPAWAQLATADISDLSSVATGITKLGTVDTGVWQATAIADTYLATISTAGKVANSATTATSANTSSAIVSRDSSGDFSARNITATLFAGSGASLTNLNASQLTSGSIAATVGGTGQTAVATGDLLYGSATNTWSRLAGNTSTTREVLLSTGTGSAGQAPSWGTLVAGDIPSLAASIITSGTLDETVGGTGHSSYAAGDLLYASGADTLARLAGNAAVAKQFLVQAGNGTVASAPQWWSLTAADVGAGTFSGSFSFAGLTLTNTLTSTLGTVTASRPWSSSTATWNNASVVFTHQFANVTDSASDAASLLVDLQVDGVSKWAIGKSGAVTTGIWNGTAIANAYLASGIDVAKLTVGTTLPSNVVTSSLTALGTIATGVWHGTAIDTAYTDAKIKTVTGTASRLSIAGTSTDPIFDIDAAYVGQTSITTLGTVATGTWNATTIATTKGGTGLTSYALGDLLYASAANTLAKLTGNITIQPKVLMQTGDGAASAAPAWHTLVVADLTDITTAATGITKVGTINTGTWQGTLLDPTYGGTGVNNGARTLTLAGNLVTSGASSITLTSTGATNVTLPTSGTLVNTAGNVATATALQTARNLWGVSFDGTSNVTAAPTFTAGATVSSGQTLTLTGATVGGAPTWTLTQTLNTSGNAATATALATPRNINSVAFDGTANITVTAAAGTLTGTTLNSTVVTSSLTSVGVLTAPHMTAPVVDSGGLTVTAGGVTVSAGNVVAEAGGIFRGQSGAPGRSDSQIEAQNDLAGSYHALISIYNRKTTGDTLQEAAVSFQANESDTPGTVHQMASISAMWSNNATLASGYAVLRFNVDQVAGASEIFMRGFGGGQGVTFYGASDTDVAGFKGVKIVRSSGKPSIAGHADLVLDANFGNGANTVFLNAFNAGDVSLAAGGGAVSVGASLTVATNITQTTGTAAFKNVTGTKFKSASGNVSAAATGTPQALYTANNLGGYLAFAGKSNGTSAFARAARFYFDGTTLYLIEDAGGASAAFSVSGTNIAYTQTSGGSVSVDWQVIYIG